MFARQPETNRFEQSRVQRGRLLGTDLTRRDLLRSVAQGAGLLSLPLVMNLQALAAETTFRKNEVVDPAVAGWRAEPLRNIRPQTGRSERELHLAATRVTDQGLAAMGTLENLEHLFLAKCAITDAGLKSVTRYPRLRSMNLYGTNITSAGLECLSELRELRTLLITDLKLSSAAVDALKSRLPQLTVSDFTPV